MIKVDTARCTGCKRCQRVCPNSAIQVNPISKKAEINNAMCSGCGICIEECPVNALAFSPLQSWKQQSTDDHMQPPQNNAYNSNASANHFPLQGTGMRGFGQGRGSGRGRHHGKGHGRGLFHKNNR